MIVSFNRWLHKSWLRAGMINLLSNFGMTLIVRLVCEDGLYIRPWMTNIIGNTIALPGFSACAAKAIKEEKSKLYSNPWFHAAIWVFGLNRAVTTVFKALEKGAINLEQLSLPSEKYHKNIFACIFYMIFSVMPLVIKSKNTKHKLLAFGFLGLYIVCLILDSTVNKSAAYKRIYLIRTKEATEHNDSLQILKN